MIGAPPPRPGKVNNRGTTDLNAITQAKKAAARKQLNKVVTKRKAKAQKPKPDPKPEVTPEPQPREDLPLIAQHCYLGQWQVLRTKPTSEGYICACVCGKTAVLTKNQLLERRTCNHTDTDQPFKDNRRAAQEFKQLMRLGLIPREYINFNDFLSVRSKLKSGNVLVIVADGLPWQPSNLIEVTGAQKKVAEQLKVLEVSSGWSALQVVKKAGLNIKNVSAYERRYGTPALVEYLRKRLDKFDEVNQ